MSALRRSLSRVSTFMRPLRSSVAVAVAARTAPRRSLATAAASASASASAPGSAAAAAAPKRFSRLVRFVDERGVERFGDQTHEKGRVVTRVLSGSPFGEYRIGSEEVEPAKYLSPLGAAHVPQIIGIGLNYTKHAHESKLPIPKYPVMFNKNISTLNHPYAPIVVPRTPSEPSACQLDYEVELAVVIGRAATNVTEADALSYVLGYTVANDVTCRKWQFVSGPTTQWNRGKSFDTFTPLGPALVHAALIPDPNALQLQTVLNGRVVQKSNTADMIFTVKQIIAYLSESTTLAPGTVILTGTPEGVGMGSTPPRYMKAGDEVAVAVEKIGELRNFVADS